MWAVWVLIEFPTNSTRTKFLTHKGMLHWLNKTLPWSRNFVPREWLIWLDIEGEVVYLDEEEEDNCYSACICIESSNTEIIMEMVEVDVEGRKYDVRVKEVTCWMPSFKKECKDSEMKEVNKPHTIENHNVEDSDDEEMDEKIEIEEFDVFKGGAENNVHSQQRGDHETCEGSQNNSQAGPTSMDTTPVFLSGFTPAASKTQSEVVLESVHPLSKGVRNEQPLGEGARSDLPGCMGNNEMKPKPSLENDSVSGSSLGFDMEGCEGDMEKLIAGIRVHRGGIQETKMCRMDLVTIKTVWGNYRFDFACSLARGLSGGILCVVDPTTFVKSRIVSHDHFVAVEGNWCNGNVRVMIITVYAPQDANEKRVLWFRLHSLVSNFQGESILMGDFNVVCAQDERLGSIFNMSLANDFNEFILDTKLIDLPLGGYQFTWVNSTASKMSKIDRFLITEGLLDRIPNLSATILDKGKPDHRPIFLKEDVEDYGPSPFSFFSLLDGVSEKRKKALEDKTALQTKIKDIDAQTDMGNVNDPVFIKDYRPISLIGSQYKIIGKLLANRIALVVEDIVSMEQSAFVKGGEKTMVFKVDFEKAYDTVCWEFLLEVMEKMRFGNKWCAWIRGCLESSMASVLVNGSPTDEFQVHRGLRQGDLLSPFLFILVMKGLHIVIENAMSAGRLLGIQVGTDNIAVSHLFYADDAIFLGEWNNTNINNIILLLRCFFLASGLKINLMKCKLMGVGVSTTEVQHMAATIGCEATTLPFVYLGVPVGENMTRVEAWKNVIDKFKSCLSKWKFGFEDIQKGGGAESDQQNQLLSLLSSCTLSLKKDRWVWAGDGTGVFTVASARSIIDTRFLVIDSTPTRWSKDVPIKINVFIWKLLFDKLPTRDNLEKKRFGRSFYSMRYL
ncbi:RNA-directed DNA polymerase, eukaryota [Tanacetum coccineum]